MSLLRRQNPGSVARAGGAVALMLLLAACATGPKYGPDSPVTTLVVPVERLAYPPLLPKLNLTAGVHYPESFRSAVAMAGGGDTPRYRYEIGAAAVALFDQQAAAMFARTVELPSIPGAGGAATGVDVVLVPRFQQLIAAFALDVDVLAPDGSSIAKIETVVMTSPPAGSEAAPPQGPAQAIATRLLAEAVGDLSSVMVLSPDLTRWTETRGLAWHWSEGSASGDAASASTGVALMVCSGLYTCSATEGTIAVSDALRKLDPSIRIVAAEELRRAVYPWMGRVSLTDAQEAEWLRRPAVADRARAAGVRYVVIARSLHQWTEEHGSIGGFGGYGGGGLIGLLWWTSHESARVHVFDFATAAEAGDLNHQREDVTFALPAFIILVPIPIPKSGEPMAEVVARQLLPLVRPKR